MHLRTLFTLIAFAVSGCAATASEEASSSSSSADELVANQPGQDVTVLQAWIGQTVGRRYANGYQLGDLALDLSRCSGEDCGGAAQSVLASELVGGFRYSADYSGQCETIEIRTVIRDSALDAPTFKGIGLYVSSLGEPVLVDKSRLAGRADSGRVTLADGSPGHVHRFVVKGMCFGLGGNGGSLYRRSYDLKPFAQFDVPETDTSYRVWDSVDQNYFLGRKADGSWVPSFDRQNELLQR